MSLARKILVLAVMLTVVTAVGLVWAISRQVTESETRRARAAIGGAVERHRISLDEQHRQVSQIVTLLMGDPQNRSLLVDVPGNATQLREEVLGRILQRELFVNHASPVFQVLLDDSGKVLLTTGVDAAAMQGVGWPVDAVLHESGASACRRYLLVDGRLFLAFGVPLRIELDDQPTHAYFAGFAVDNSWAAELLKGRADDLPLAAVFLVDGKALARSGGNPAVDARLADQSQATVDVEVDGEKLVAQRLDFDLTGNQNGTIYVYSSLTRALEPLRQLKRRVFYTTLAVLPLIVFLIARSLRVVVGKPVERLVRASRSIARGDFSVELPDANRRDEFGELARSFNEMSSGLAQRDLIKHTLGQFVDPRIADALLTNPGSLRGKRAIQSVLFSDLRNFTSISEKLPPERLVELLNRYLGRCADTVRQFNGYLDKFTGDGCVAFWGPPVEHDHAVASVRGAMKMVELSREFDGECASLGIDTLHVRVGIATGEALVGLIGSDSGKQSYTAMGDVVNLASRLEGVNKLYGTQVLIDSATRALLPADILTRHIDTVRVLGRAAPVELFEVMTETDRHRVEQYACAMELYRARKWDGALGAFQAIDDAPSRIMAVRCMGFRELAPSDDWDGVWNLDQK